VNRRSQDRTTGSPELEAALKILLPEGYSPAAPKRGRGRPRITDPRPWEFEGISKRTYYRRRQAEQKGKT
jgi:hypothetical protein